jgi:hypothetical protein
LEKSKTFHVFGGRKKVPEVLVLMPSPSPPTTKKTTIITAAAACPAAIRLHGRHMANRCPFLGTVFDNFSLFPPMKPAQPSPLIYNYSLPPGRIAGELSAKFDVF